MPKPEPSIDLENAEFAALALESLQEGVRRAFIEHEGRGFLVPGWSQAEIEWVSPGEKLSLYEAPGQSRLGTDDAEQVAADDAETASRSRRV